MVSTISEDVKAIQSNMDFQNLKRRTVLKGIGAGAGGMALTGTATAEPQKRGQHHSYAWANGVEWDMLEPEPPGGGDSEGAEPAHRPLWVIAATELCNSPHPAPFPGIDHVIPLGPGGIYTAQWHVHVVAESGTTLEEVFNDPSLLVNRKDGGTSTGGDPDDYLLSADAITAGDGVEFEVHAIPNNVFTCPARPGSCDLSED